MHQFHKFILSWNSTCFGQLVCPSSGVYSLYTQRWYMSYRFVDSFRAGPGLNWFHPGPASMTYVHTPSLSVQWINSWWWTDKLSETCTVSWQNKFVKLVHLVGFIIKKSNLEQHLFYFIHSGSCPDLYLTVVFVMLHKLLQVKCGTTASWWLCSHSNCSHAPPPHTILL